MRCVIDLEANGLKPTKIWVICCKDIDTGEFYVFRNITEDPTAFLLFANKVTLWVGHNILGYDFPVLRDLLGFDLAAALPFTIDTFILSKLVDYPREGGHSIEDYGREFSLPKGVFSDWSKYSQEMEEYCKRDVEICHRIYLKYRRVINDPKWHPAIDTEQRFQLVCNTLHDNGFHFNKSRAEGLLAKVKEELAKLDKDILTAFPPKEEFLRKVRYNKDGSIHRIDTRYFDLPHLYTVRDDTIYARRVFNPASHKQLIDVLHGAGWDPTDRTRTHIDYYRDRSRVKDRVKEEHLKKYGWKINESNLLTLPASAPSAAKTLARRILYESRRRTLAEWLSLVQADGRIHGDFQGIGAWTHRMAHQKPNTANIPNETDEQGRIKLLGGDLRQLWSAPKGRLLVGCDAEGIQLRIFAHYINDPEFTKEVCDGDPHSLNQSVLGSCCRTRQAAKRFIYALLLGAGIGKLGEILEAGRAATESALARILDRYTGFAYLRKQVFPTDIRRGWFLGLDGRRVKIPHVEQKPHLVMSGYLQNGESIVMKRATLKWTEQLKCDNIQHILVDLVHDEWQTECENNVEIAKKIGQAQCDALRKVGEELKLNCPLAGSFYNKKKKDFTIGTNWRVTH